MDIYLSSRETDLPSQTSPGGLVSASHLLEMPIAYFRLNLLFCLSLFRGQLVLGSMLEWLVWSACIGVTAEEMRTWLIGCWALV